MRRISAAALLLILLIFPLLPSCSSSPGVPATALSFSREHSADELRRLDGETVSIRGFISTQIPPSGKFFYLKSLPYQSCPFCIPNGARLTNTLAVYPAEGGFTFTDSAISVTGTLEFTECRDELGYQYSYRLKDASFTVLESDQLEPRLALWQELAAAGVPADIAEMFDYLSFLCLWPTYTTAFEGSADYLYPSDALSFLTVKGAQFNYGNGEDYFERIIADIDAVSRTELGELSDIILEAEAIALDAKAELEEERYDALDEYSDVFGDGRTQYRLHSAEELCRRMEACYGRFAAWLATWAIDQ